jgi:hypothetical protein
MSIVDTGRFWEILVIPVLQIKKGGKEQTRVLEDTGILVFTSICTSIADTGRYW